MGYLQQLRKLVKKQGSGSLVYVDETGFDQNDYRPYGWADKGKTIHGERRGNRTQRTSLLLAQCGNERLAPMLFEGTCTSDLFNDWLDKFLMPQLNKGQTIIMDNARFHKHIQTKKIIEKHRCQLLYLPPYSPDFNPIEKFFGALKKLKQSKLNSTTLDQFICSTI